MIMNSTVHVSPRPTAKQVKNHLPADNMKLLRVVEGEDVTANLAPKKKRKMASDTPREAPKWNPPRKKRMNGF